MNEYVNVNGTIVAADGPVISLKNRAFHFGDGLFETMRVVKGRLCFTDQHWARLVTGAGVLRIGIPAGLDQHSFEQQALELMKRCGLDGGRVRFTLYRGGEGYYRPIANTGAYTIEATPLEDAHHILNEQGLIVDIFPETRKSINYLAVHKTLNCQLYVMASLWCTDRGLDDCMLQNERGNIIESSSGNIFIVSNGVLYTPSLADGCVGGVMRAQVINLALKHGIKVYECSLNPQNLLAADELFFTNAVTGIRWVATYRTKRYSHRLAGMLLEHLIEQTLN